MENMWFNNVNVEKNFLLFLLNIPNEHFTRLLHESDLMLKLAQLNEYLNEYK